MAIYGPISFINKELENRGVNGRTITDRIYRTEVNILQSKVMWRLKGTVPVGLYMTTNTYRFSRAGQCYTKYGYAWVNILYK